MKKIDYNYDWNSPHSPGELYRLYQWLKEARIWAQRLYKIHKMLWKEIRRLKLENKHLRAHTADMETSIEDMCNELWAIMYPNDPTGWGYRTQPLAHIRVYIEELREDNLTWEIMKSRSE